MQLADLIVLLKSNLPIRVTFNTVKWLLGLSYLWTDSKNGIQLRMWGTWLSYAVLVDLGDAVADELSLQARSHIFRNDLSWSLSFFCCTPKRFGF